MGGPLEDVLALVVSRPLGQWNDSHSPACVRMYYIYPFGLCPLDRLQNPGFTNPRRSTDESCVCRAVVCAILLFQSDVSNPRFSTSCQQYLLTSVGNHFHLLTSPCCSPPSGPVDTKQVLTKKLEGLGAKIAGRLGKEVTHVVFQRQRNADKQEQLAEDSELRNLFEKTAKVCMMETCSGERSHPCAL